MQRAIQKIQRLQLGPIRHGQIEFNFGQKQEKQLGVKFFPD